MSSAGGSMQRRRYTITTAREQKNEYPEHLNPFREENEDGKTNNKFSSLGRRNSRLTSSLRLRSWFPSKSSKPDQPDTDSPTKPKEKFLTLTPKISRQIKEVFTHKKNKNKSDNNLAPIPQYVPIQKPLPDQFVGGEFTLSPRASRERYAAPSTSTTLAAPGEEAERRSESPAGQLQGVQPPKPLPRTILPKTTARVREEEAEEPLTKPPASPDGDAQKASTSGAGGLSDNNTLKITEDDNKYIRQGARPKKKRQAPLPPTRPSPSTSCTVVNEADLSEEISQSAPINSGCPSPNPEPALESATQAVPESPTQAVPESPESPESPPSSSTSPTEGTKEDRLI